LTWSIFDAVFILSASFTSLQCSFGFVIFHAGSLYSQVLPVGVLLRFEF